MCLALCLKEKKHIMMRRCFLNTVEKKRWNTLKKSNPKAKDVKIESTSMITIEM